MKKFEYKKIDLAGSIQEDVFVLNELGKEGWELINVKNNEYLFKKEIPFIETKTTGKQLLQESYKHKD